MCGITAIIGTSDLHKKIIESLFALQNRGYDSAGICSIKDNKIVIRKYIGHDSISSLSMCGEDFRNVKVIVGHNRWATNGKVLMNNAHPLLSMDNNLAIVHNGIITNSNLLKNYLLDKGVIFESNTDTEVIIQYIGYMCRVRSDCELSENIEYVISLLEGTYALIIISLYEPNKVYCVRKGSPLIIGMGDGVVMAVSEINGLNNSCTSFVSIDELSLVSISIDDNGHIEHNLSEMYTYKPVEHCNSVNTCYPYKKWMIKEIYDQPHVSDILIKNGIMIPHWAESRMKCTKYLFIIGCGTSYYACEHVSYLMRKYCRHFATLQSVSGNDFNINMLPNNVDSSEVAAIFLSQSGETYDLLGILKSLRNLNILTIGITNTKQSTIANMVDLNLHIYAGREVSVASTKSFTNQIIACMILMNKWKKLFSGCELPFMVRKIYQLPQSLGASLLLMKDMCKSCAMILKNEQSVFVLGRGTYTSIAHEGALKIKEVADIHAESYSSASLKHGPYGIIKEGFPVIMLISDDSEKSYNESTMHELEARGANIIVISDYYVDTKYNIITSSFFPFTGLFFAMALQLIAYELSVEKMLDCDKPRNLAKVCTVS